MKTLTCNKCGAKLSVDGSSANAKCEYCGTLVRVVDDAAMQQYNSVNILNQIIQLGSHVRKDNFDSKYEQIKELVEKHRYLDACSILNDILSKDHTQARAWFYKSLLPVLEQESVIFHGCYVNVNVISKITNRALISEYLVACGLPRFRHKAFMKFYGSTHFLYEQQVRYIDKAIEFASTPERVAFFQKHKRRMLSFQRKKIRRRMWTNIGLILLLFTVFIGAIIFVREVLIDTFRKI